MRNASYTYFAGGVLFLASAIALMSGASAEPKASPNTLSVNGVTVKDDENRTRVTSVVGAGGVAGSWYVSPAHKSQIGVYTSSDQGAVIAFYRDGSQAECDFAIFTDKTGTWFQVPDADGKQVHIPVRALLRLMPKD